MGTSGDVERQSINTSHKHSEPQHEEPRLVISADLLITNYIPSIVRTALTYPAATTVTTLPLIGESIRGPQ